MFGGITGILSYPTIFAVFIIHSMVASIAVILHKEILTPLLVALGTVHLKYCGIVIKVPVLGL